MLARLALFALLLGSGASQAECECLWQGSFAEVQGDTDLVISATVIGAKGNAIDLSVDRQLRGHAHREDIRVWLKTGD